MPCSQASTWTVDACTKVDSGVSTLGQRGRASSPSYLYWQRFFPLFLPFFRLWLTHCTCDRQMTHQYMHRAATVIRVLTLQLQEQKVLDAVLIFCKKKSGVVLVGKTYQLGQSSGFAASKRQIQSEARGRATSRWTGFAPAASGQRRGTRETSRCGVHHSVSNHTSRS
jgi:hypothetical protein